MSVNSCSVTLVTLSLPLRASPAGARSHPKIRTRKNHATTAATKNATPTLMILDRSSPRCSIRVIRASSRGPRGREGRRRRPAIYYLRVCRGLGALLLGLVGFDGGVFGAGILGAGLGLVGAGGELFSLGVFLLFLDLVLAAGALSELPHPAAEALSELRDALRAEEQEDDDQSYDQLRPP